MPEYFISMNSKNENKTYIMNAMMQLNIFKQKYN